MTRAAVFCDLPDGRTTKVGDVDFRTNDGGHLVATTFTYTEAWLTATGGYVLSPELPAFTGRQTFTGERLVPGPIADTGPDRWGQNLLFAAERRAARREGRPLRTLNQGDFVLLARDLTRQGALRFSADNGATYMSDQRDGVPTLMDLGALVDAARRQSRDRGTDADLDLLVRAGTSAGGARPKVTVRTDTGRLALAKLPRADDTWDVQAWEATALELAERAGVAVAPFELHRIDQDTSVLVVERFDRTGAGARVGYLSAHSLVEKTAARAVSYAELADALAPVSADPDADRHDLFRRIALSLMINNVDDHMKNHGLLRTSTGWRLSPVFDINPFPAGRAVDSTPISVDGSGESRDVHELLDAAGYFGLAGDEAADVIVEVEAATRGWAEIAARHGIEDPEDGAVATAFTTSSRAQAVELSRSAAIEVGAVVAATEPGGDRTGQHLRNGRPVGGRRPREP